jgi:hypothetical protein
VARARRAHVANRISANGELAAAGRSRSAAFRVRAGNAATCPGCLVRTHLRQNEDKARCEYGDRSASPGQICEGNVITVTVFRYWPESDQADGNFVIAGNN